MLLGDEEGVVKAITHLPPEAGTMGGDPASILQMHVSNNVRFQFRCVYLYKMSVKTWFADPLL